METRSSSTGDTSTSVTSIKSGVMDVYNTLQRINKDVRATKTVSLEVHILYPDKLNISQKITCIKAWGEFSVVGLTGVTVEYITQR